MCGRFFLDAGAIEQIEHLTRIPEWIASRLDSAAICPSKDALVIAAGQNPHTLEARLMPFGVISARYKKRIINARAETLPHRPLFAPALQAANGRCVIAASSFVEWTESKEPVTFYLPDRRVMYFAGLILDGCFVIITTAANASMEPFHARMPLILNEDQARQWIEDPSRIASLLALQPPLLAHLPVYEQTPLF